MNGTEIINMLASSLPSTFMTAIGPVVGSLFTAIYLRHKTATQEFEKIKAGKFQEVANDLLASGEMTYSEYYKAKNFLTISKKADAHLSKIPVKKEYDAYDFDWFMRFYETVGNISNEEMQELWARILAGEINQTQVFSLQTMDVLKNVGKEDALLFDKICQFSICSEGEYSLPRYDEYLKQAEIQYSDIMRLRELGLIFNDASIALTVKLKNGMNFLMLNRELLLTYNIYDEQLDEFQVAQYPFTKVGNEIASLKGLCATDRMFLTFAREVKKSNTQAGIEVHKILDQEGDAFHYDQTDLLENFSQNA